MKLSPVISVDTVKGLAAAGDFHLIGALTFLRHHGFDLRSEPRAVVEWCMTQAESGSPEAQYVLAEMLIVGLFVEQDHVEALRWCRQSSQAGFGPALMLLAEFYFSGWGGVDVDKNCADTLMKRSADNGFVPAIRTLGLALVESRSSKDADEGIRLLNMAAQKGDLYAETYLALRGLKSGDSKEGTGEAIERLERAAIAGDVHANRMLGHFYKNGDYGLSRDDERAARLLERADELERALLEDLE